MNVESSLPAVPSSSRKSDQDLGPRTMNPSISISNSNFDGSSQPGLVDPTPGDPPKAPIIQRTIPQQDVESLYDPKNWNRRSALAVSERPHSHQTNHGQGRPGGLILTRHRHIVVHRKPTAVSVPPTPSAEQPVVEGGATPPPDSGDSASEADDDSLFGPEPPSPREEQSDISKYLQGLEISFPDGTSDGITNASTTPIYPTSPPPPTTNPNSSNDPINYITLLPLTHKTSLHWLHKVGHHIAKSFLHLPNADLVAYRMKSWPDHYRLYEHRTGDRHRPRRDCYLYGSRRVWCFRSPEEFYEHAFWIMNGGDNAKEECKCKYCSKWKRKGRRNTVH
ncbi:hypothetical protein SISSUDRAFT_266950 [Sistotremastrum suecicum HHB10207 ss-3]|uniref:Cryptic loci regulator 2 N-terminal domain-containing protein n=1 Tax=Sistotremastrum suecicum HHB10207 ss-3 TaxID=1314776 RepID=A0A165ZTB6_9AGAM|nr:hypothetical protein SISSUDRAFT_266950 [Sistotremastrum suecicum HHB10207 ss-3]